MTRRCATILGVFLSIAPAAAIAQAPPPPGGPEGAAVAQCLCLRQSMERAFSEMGAKRNAMDRVTADLAQANAEIDRERATLNVNDPQAVAAFRQKLERRDALFRRSNGEINADVAAAVQRYNDRVNGYNQQCANRPFDPGLTAQVQATLICTPE